MGGKERKQKNVSHGTDPILFLQVFQSRKKMIDIKNGIGFNVFAFSGNQREMPGDHGGKFIEK